MSAHPSAQPPRLSGQPPAHSPARHTRPRSRRRSLRMELDHDVFEIWMPSADEPVLIESFGEAASFAFEVADWNAEREVLVLLDARRRVTAMLLDPPPPLGVLIGSCDLPALEVPFCQTLSIVITPCIDDGPPHDDDRSGYFGLRRLHMLQGLQLLDVILVDHERVRSLAIACDPDPVWFEPFDPLQPLQPFDAHDQTDAELG